MSSRFPDKYSSRRTIAFLFETEVSRSDDDVIQLIDAFWDPVKIKDILSAKLSTRSSDHILKHILDKLISQPAGSSKIVLECLEILINANKHELVQYIAGSAVVVNPREQPKLEKLALQKSSLPMKQAVKALFVKPQQPSAQRPGISSTKLAPPPPTRTPAPPPPLSAHTPVASKKEILFSHNMLTETKGKSPVHTPAPPLPVRTSHSHAASATLRTRSPVHTPVVSKDILLSQKKPGESSGKKPPPPPPGASAERPKK